MNGLAPILRTWHAVFPIPGSSALIAGLSAAGLPTDGGPGPIVALIPRATSEARRLSKALLAAGIHPPLIRYPGGPAEGYFRFVISSEHTEPQLAGLSQVLSRHRRRLTQPGTTT